MALRNLLHKRTAPLEALDEEQLREFCPPCEGVVAIAEARPRERVTVVGEISDVRVVPKADTPWLEVTVSDATGRIVATWTGRRRIAGIELGQRLVLTGRPSPTGPGGRLLFYNPLYELL